MVCFVLFIFVVCSEIQMYIFHSTIFQTKIILFKNTAKLININTNISQGRDALIQAPPSLCGVYDSSGSGLGMTDLNIRRLSVLTLEPLHVIYKPFLQQRVWYTQWHPRVWAFFSHTFLTFISFGYSPSLLV